MTRNQRRHSFSNQKEYSLTISDTNNNDDDSITVLGPNELGENTFPLTEENLAIHTNNVSA